MKSDEQLQSEIQAEINACLPEPGEVGVAVHHGVVTLRGVVDTVARKRWLEQAAWKVEGVRAVAEEVTVRTSETGLTDGEIAEGVASTLEWSEAIDARDVRARVEHGWVTLTGSVATAAESEHAERLADQVRDVVGVSNRIRVVEPVSIASASGWQPVDEEC
jgi:osmotically-inducible protein OsmY